MDLFDPSDDFTPVDEKIYQKLVGMLIWTLKLRFETQLAVIMACSHNSNPTQGDQTKVIRLLAYFSGCQDLGPTWFTTEGPVLVASCDAAFAVHPTTGGSQLSISFRIGSDNAPFHVISKIQTTKISINPTHSEYNAFSIATEHIKFYRRYLAWLGYPQLEPTPLENAEEEHKEGPVFYILLHANNCWEVATHLTMVQLTVTSYGWYLLSMRLVSVTVLHRQVINQQLVR
jgi:hypothetical protein